MLVQKILQAKGSSDVITIAPDAKIETAIALLTTKRIGAVVVSNSGDTADGILSERDVVRSMGNSGTACLDKPVSAYMTPSPVCAKMADTTDQILEIMTEKRFRHMPVIDDGKLVGLISIGDVVKSRLDELSMEKDALAGMIMGH